MISLKKVYLEIGNVCNLNCSFCPGTDRAPHQMTEEKFRACAERIRPHCAYLYLHLMGEPLLHPLLERFLEIAAGLDFRVIITTNGTLLKAKGAALLAAAAVHKVNVSLQAFEGNCTMPLSFSDYMSAVTEFASRCSDAGKICVLRLWNGGGENRRNEEIKSLLFSCFPEPSAQRGGIRLAPNVFLEEAARFDWPDMAADEQGTEVFCHGLRDQIGVLCDGTVVPCCLDHNGDIPLGNLLQTDLQTILNSARAQSIYDGFSRRLAAEPLCRRCGYASRFRR